MTSRNKHSGRGGGRVEPLEPRRLFAIPGSLDTSFSGDGKATLTLTTDEVLTAADVAVQEDGKTVVVGSAHNTFLGERYFFTARFNFDGTPDQGFGTGGIVRTQLSDLGDSNATAVAIAPDGKIVVVGEAEVSGGIDEQELAAARYNTDGSLDNSFDGNGVLSRDLSGIDFSTYVSDVAIRPNGSIVIVGDAILDGYAAYFTVDGAFIDVTHFDFGLSQIGDVNAVKLDSSGRIVVVGSAFDGSICRAALARLSEIVLPPQVGGGTVVAVDYETTFPLHGPTETIAADLLLQPDGKVVIAGNTLAADGQHDFFVARFTATGQLDTTFGEQSLGYTVTEVGGQDVVGGIVPTPTGGGGGFIVSGRSGTSTMVAVKYSDAGILDTTFGSAGIARVFGFTGLDRGSSGLHGGFAPSIAPGLGRRFMLAGGNGFGTARLLLAGAREVSAGVGDSLAIEGTTNTASFFVRRTERLPIPTRVFFSVGGTASFPIDRTSPRDYSMPGMTFPAVIGGAAFVDIPANETFVMLTLTTINDTRLEGNESAAFSIRSNSGYDIGSPDSGSITIRDDEMPDGTIGTTTATVLPKQVGVGQELQVAATWTVPSGGWRQLSSIQLRLRDLHDEDALAVLTFDEATNSFSVECTPAAGDDPVSLVLSKCTFQADGPTAPTVTVIFTFRLNAAAAAQRRFALDVAATNDTDGFSGFAQIGELLVHKKPNGDALVLPL